MAYDSKRLQMFKWLEKVALQKASYAKGVFTGRINEILTIYGDLYATNGILLAQIDYPEFEHISDFGWMKVARYVDDNGYLLETPELAETERNFRDRMFVDMFIDKWEVSCGFAFDPKVMKDALKPFEIYGITPNICIYSEYRKCELTGHNKDVSIRVLFMGVK